MRRILIVDNDPAAALVTQRGLQILLAPQASVEIASSPGAAWLSCVRGDVDLLIVDPGGADRSAMALVKALHHDHPEISVLVLTAYDTPRLRNQMRAFGARAYLAKPISLDELRQTINTAIPWPAVSP